MLPFAQGAAYGFSAAASPGPFQAYVLAQALRVGAARALPLALAPLASDGPIIALVLLALSGAPEGLLRVLQIAGGAFLLWVAWGTASSLRAASAAATAPVADASAARAFWKGVLVNALGPGPWVFWSLVTGPILVRTWRESAALGVSFLAGFYLLLCGGVAALVVVFSTARRLGPAVVRTLTAASAVALLALGLRQLWIGIAGG